MEKQPTTIMTEDVIFHFEMRKIEADIRGNFIALACYAEKLLEEIICKCRSVSYDNLESYRIEKLIAKSFSNKIDTCKSELEVFDKYWFEFLMPKFKMINKYMESRHMLCHGQAIYDEKNHDKSFIIFTHLEKKNWFCLCSILYGNRERKITCKLISCLAAP